MIDLYLIGIGTGNPDHTTRQAIKALNSADLVLIPGKGADKSDLAKIRRDICSQVISGDGPEIIDFELPTRNPENPNYLSRVHDWHDAIAAIWKDQISEHLGTNGRVAFLVWGDPSLYDSTLRIAERVAKTIPMKITVIPGITALQVLTAAHAIPINDLANPFTVTTGRQLRENGWPPETQTLAVMLDGECSFQTLAADDFHIWWTAFAGMPQEINVSGPLADVGPEIIKVRSKARADHGWLMDIYLLRKLT